METTSAPVSDSPLKTTTRSRQVRESLERLAVRMMKPLQSIATSMRSTLPMSLRFSTVTSDEHFDITVDLPGIDAADVDVAIDGSTLTIRGTRNEQRERHANGYYRMERYSKVFQRAVVLKSPIDLDKATATLRNGVLEVQLPKARSGNGVGQRSQVPVRAA